MNAGELNRRVTIQQLASMQDDHGQPGTAWSTVATLWASIADLSGREYLAADAQQSQAQTKITIRYRSGILPAMRVLHGVDVYNIEAVLRGSGALKDALLLMCSRGVNNG